MATYKASSWLGCSGSLFRGSRPSLCPGLEGEARRVCKLPGCKKTQTQSQGQMSLYCPLLGIPAHDHQDSRKGNTRQGLAQRARQAQEAQEARADLQY